MYDGNDTGYYVDPNSTSHLYNINNKNYITYPTSNGDGYQKGDINHIIIPIVPLNLCTILKYVIFCWIYTRKMLVSSLGKNLFLFLFK